MSASVQVLEREFKFKNRVLKDPNPAFTIDQVRKHYLGLYPDLLNTSPSETRKKGKTTIEFKPKVGSHG